MWRSHQTSGFDILPRQTFLVNRSPIHNDSTQGTDTTPGCEQEAEGIVTAQKVVAQD